MERVRDGELEGLPICVPWAIDLRQRYFVEQ